MFLILYKENALKSKASMTWTKAIGESSMYGCCESPLFDFFRSRTLMHAVGLLNVPPQKLLVGAGFLLSHHFDFCFCGPGYHGFANPAFSEAEFCLILVRPILWRTHL